MKENTAFTNVAGGRIIAFHHEYAKLSNSINAGLFLSQACYWSRCSKDMGHGGWFYKTQADWTAETYLSRREQDTARKYLKALGVLGERLEGMPAQLFFRVDFARLEEALNETAKPDKHTQIEQTSIPPTATPVFRQQPNMPSTKRQPSISTQITTEITTESTLSDHEENPLEVDTEEPPNNPIRKSKGKTTNPGPSPSEIYDVYPLKVGKPAAIRAIEKQLREFSGEFLLERTRAYAAAPGRDPEFTPHPATWFNQERFNDDPSTWVKTPTQNRPTPQNQNRPEYREPLPKKVGPYGSW